MRPNKTNEKAYGAFASLLRKLRAEAGISNQEDLAKLVGRSQQSVSRWEAGTSRPKPDDIAKLALLLNVPADELLVGAGYKSAASAAGTITFDKPLPIENLPPDAFERFLWTVLQALHPSAVVKRAGQSGHKQDGIDVIATLEDGTVQTFQCKRVKTFGPADVQRAVAAHTVNADRNFLVLSRVASPQATTEIARHTGWEILDKEDLSRMVRSLSIDVQDRLVDTYFPGKRFELFGRTDAGPWMTLEDFFEPFEARDAAFSHDWALKGRDVELEQIAGFLADSSNKVVLISAPGGFGKSRIVKESLRVFQELNPACLVRFLSPTASATATDLDSLGQCEKILVVDDAHDREDLGALLHYAASPSHRTRLILASRPYGTPRIKQQAAVFGLSQFVETILAPLTKANLSALAAEVLVEFGGNADWAPHVLSIAGQSPLIVVMAARVMAKEPIPPALVTSREELKNFILGKFQKVVVGDLGTQGDQVALSKMLNILAIIQPFDTHEPEFKATVSSVADIDEITSARLVKLLADGGVIFKRGRYFRLMPDVLGDYLIDQSCIDSNGELTPLALEIFAASDDAVAGRTLLNLGRLDWRRSEGDPADSQLLNQIWRSLDGITEPWDRRLEAVQDVALYQPGQALAFVQRLLDRGHHFPIVARILSRIAFSGTHFAEAAELLWLLGREDSRAFGPHPDHPLRLLSEIVAVEENKPFQFSERAFEFGMALLDREDAWTGEHTPLDVVAPMLRGDGMTTESDHRQMTMKPFVVRYETVEPLRKRLVQRLLNLMVGDNPLAGQHAAAFLQHALRAPMPAFNHGVSEDVRALYEKEFVGTLRKILKLSRANALQPPVAISLAKSVSWHASYGAGKTSKLAQQILDAMPTTLEFRTWVALADGFGQVFLGRWNPDNWESTLTKWIGDLVADLKHAHNDPRSLLRFIEDIQSGLAAAGITDNSSHVLMGSLLRAELGFARAIVEGAFSDSDRSTSKFVASAVSEILSAEPAEGRALVKRLLSSQVPLLRAAAGSAYGGLRRSPDGEDFELLRTIVADDDWRVVNAAVRSSWGWQIEDPLRMLSLVRSARIGDSSRVADDLCMFLTARQQQLVASMGAEDVADFLEKLVYVPELDGHWVNEFLAFTSEHFAIETAEFFFKRVERYSNKTWFNKSRPSNHGPWSQQKLRFRESPRVAEVLDRTWNWLKTPKDAEYYFHYNAAHLFEAMFPGIDSLVVTMMDSKLEGADVDDLERMALLVQNATPGFVFEHQAFVGRLLERCRATDRTVLERTLANLEISACSGVRGGTPGEPFPQDVQMEQNAEQAMKAVSRLSPAYQLYNAIRERARWSIRRQRSDAETFEE